jgi:hypothetical protein
VISARAGEEVTVRLFFDRPARQPPRLALTLSGVEDRPEEPIRLEGSLDGIEELVEIPASVRLPRRPGTYTLRVAGTSRTFGRVDVER